MSLWVVGCDSSEMKSVSGVMSCKWQARTVPWRDADWNEDDAVL